jgi:hypothetical protein
MIDPLMSQLAAAAIAVFLLQRFSQASHMEVKRPVQQRFYILKPDSSGRRSHRRKQCSAVHVIGFTEGDARLGKGGRGGV